MAEGAAALGAAGRAGGRRRRSHAKADRRFDAPDAGRARRASSRARRRSKVVAEGAALVVAGRRRAATSPRSDAARRRSRAPARSRAGRARRRHGSRRRRSLVRGRAAAVAAPEGTSWTARSAAVAIVGVGAILPDAPDAATFWDNVANGRYSDQRGAARPLGPGPLLRPRSARRPTRPTRRSAAGYATGTWDPMGWRLPIPPKVGDAMDDAQKWAVACTREALADYGWPERPLDLERTAVILGNAMAGEKHYLTALRIAFPEYRARARARRRASRRCPTDVRAAIPRSCTTRIDQALPDDHRGHDARRARQLHRRSDRQPVQPPRPELRRRRRLRVGDGRDRARRSRD